uniref:Uncharacterized protein n=1 Tax=Rhizophora mucronata TaxID=61149 RepID=A0A2P2PP03_RHIMU
MKTRLDRTHFLMWPFIYLKVLLLQGRSIGMMVFWSKKRMYNSILVAYSYSSSLKFSPILI